MWHCRIWFSKDGGVGWMVGLNDLRGLFQPMILRLYVSMTVIHTYTMCPLPHPDSVQFICQVSINFIISKGTGSYKC